MSGVYKSTSRCHDAASAACRARSSKLALVSSMCVSRNIACEVSVHEREATSGAFNHSPAFAMNHWAATALLPGFDSVDEMIADAPGSCQRRQGRPLTGLRGSVIIRG